MKNVSRLVLLAGVTGLAFWSLLDITPACAYGPICQNIQGAPCSPEGRERSCVDAYDGGPGLCICNDGLWNCGTGTLFSIERVHTQKVSARPTTPAIPRTTSAPSTESKPVVESRIIPWSPFRGLSWRRRAGRSQSQIRPVAVESRTDLGACR